MCVYILSYDSRNKRTGISCAGQFSTLIINKLPKIVIFNNGENLMTNFKKATLMLVALVFSVMTFVTTVNANPPNPPPDCPQTPFLGPLQGTIMMDGCTITYTYWWRLACGIWYDTYIDSWTVSGPPDCQNAFNPDEYQRIVDAIQADIVMVQNPWGLNIFDYMCYNWTPIQWRFYRPSCMSEYFPVWEGGHLKLKTVPCFPTDMQSGYCYSLYRFCWRIVNGEIVLHNEKYPGGYFGGVVRCPHSIPHPNGTGMLRCRPWTCDEDVVE